MKIFKYLIESIFIYTFFLIIKLIGLKQSRKIFSLLFRAVGPLIRSSKTIRKNLKIAFPEIEKKDQDIIIKKMWSNYAMTFVEYIYLKKFNRENYHINIKNEEILDKVLKNNKPVIFISGHFANFELMSMEIVKKGIKLSTIYRPLNNFFLNPFMEHVRRKYVCKNQIKKGITGIRHTFDFLKQNYSVALMVDQRVSEGKKVSFFKKEALTTTLPAQLSIKFKCDIIPVYITRQDNGNFLLEFFEQLQINKEDKSERNILEITEKLNSIIEKMILNNPGDWIWTHNRWK
jgi:KDO2-lipid IV(A) lauroyltransferase